MQRFVDELIDIQLADGSWQTVHPVSLRNRAMLLKRISQIYTLLANENDSQATFREYFDANSQFRHVCVEALKLCNIDADSISLDTLYALLFPHYDAEGNRAEKGALIEQNFDVKQFEGARDAKPSPEILNETVAKLWAICGNLQDAIAIVSNNEIPADDLFSIIKHHSELLQTPEAKRKAFEANSKKQAKDLLTNMHKQRMEQMQNAK